MGAHAIELLPGGLDSLLQAGMERSMLLKMSRVHHDVPASLLHMQLIQCLPGLARQAPPAAAWAPLLLAFFRFATEPVDNSSTAINRVCDIAQYARTSGPPHTAGSAAVSKSVTPKCVGSTPFACRRLLLCVGVTFSHYGPRQGKQQGQGWGVALLRVPSGGCWRHANLAHLASRLSVALWLDRTPGAQSHSAPCLERV